jgi:hypothetical protein
MAIMECATSRRELYAVDAIHVRKSSMWLQSYREAVELLARRFATEDGFLKQPARLVFVWRAEGEAQGLVWAY